jgi:hypothetical protein
MKAGYVARTGETRNEYIVLEKPEGKKQFRTSRRKRHKYEDNIKMDLSDIGWEGVNWFDSG